MINCGNFNLDNTVGANTVIKITDATGTQTLSGAGLTNPSGGLLGVGTIYSAAGTPLPAASTALKGATAIVSDATTPTYGATYTSGGAVYARVLCTGTDWITA